MIVCPWKDIARYAPVIPGLEEAVATVNALESFEPRTVPLSGANKILVQQGTTKAAQGQLLEAHREFLDIQYIVRGGETMGWAPIEALTLSGEFNTAKDKGMYTGKNYPMEIEAGYCYVVYPEDAHAPGTYLEESGDVTKLVIKLKV